MDGLILKRIESARIFHPLQELGSHIAEWYERDISPDAVVIALGSLAGRDLKPFEERDARVWLGAGIIGRNQPPGDLL
jgi:hypothetical protein